MNKKAFLSVVGVVAAGLLGTGAFLYTQEEASVNTDIASVPQEETPSPESPTPPSISPTAPTSATPPSRPTPPPASSRPGTTPPASSPTPPPSGSSSTPSPTPPSGTPLSSAQPATTPLSTASPSTPPPAGTGPTTAQPATTPLSTAQPGTPPTSAQPVTSTTPPTRISPTASGPQNTMVTGQNVLTADLTPPKITAISVANGDDRRDIDESDKITITFSEKINPISIHPQLSYGGSVSGVGAGATGNVTSQVNNETQFITIHNIMTFAYRLGGYTGTRSLTASTVSLGLDPSGTVLVIRLVNATGGDAGTPPFIRTPFTSQGLRAGDAIAGVVKDVRGNSLQVGVTPVPAGEF